MNMNHDIGRSFAAALVSIACWFHAGAALGSLLVERESIGTGGAVPEYVSFIRSIAGARDVVLANKPSEDNARRAKALPGRVRTWTERNTPYCEDDGPESRCMSCLGFVMRVLFPGRHNNYPDVPRDFQRAVTGLRYTTHDLLLYLTGMFDFPGRDARLRRLARLPVPDNLRADLSILVRTLPPAAAAPASGSGQAANSPQRQPATGARKKL